jgi:hypothetical protein
MKPMSEILEERDPMIRIAEALEKTTNYRTGEVTELRGIRNALEEILRLVKEDQEKVENYRKKKEDDDFLDKQSNAEYYDEKN